MVLPVRRGKKGDWKESLEKGGGSHQGKGKGTVPKCSGEPSEKFKTGGMMEKRNCRGKRGEKQPL